MALALLQSCPSPCSSSSAPISTCNSLCTPRAFTKSFSRKIVIENLPESRTIKLFEACFGSSMRTPAFIRSRRRCWETRLWTLLSSSFLPQEQPWRSVVMNRCESLFSREIPIFFVCKGFLHYLFRFTACSYDGPVWVFPQFHYQIYEAIQRSKFLSPEGSCWFMPVIGKVTQ